jgi:hypothetical protein
MLRRLGCLSVLVGLFLFLAVVSVIGWFGFQAYSHAAESQAIASRMQVVTQAWADDPAAVSKAVTSPHAVRPKGLSAQPYQERGATPITSAVMSHGALVVGGAVDPCGEPLVAHVTETPVVVAVLLSPDQPWLPDWSRLWQRVRRAPTCTSTKVPSTVTVALSAPLGKRVVVDLVTGASVPLPRA